MGGGFLLILFLRSIKEHKYGAENEPDRNNGTYRSRIPKLPGMDQCRNGTETGRLFCECMGYVEQGICREFADCTLVEMETSVSNERLDKIYQKNIASLNENLQEGLALGSFVLKPLGEAAAEFISADKIIPISFGDDGKPIDIAFLTVKKVGDVDYFTRFERHYFINGNLTIENKCFHSQTSRDIGLPCSLEAVEEWANIDPGPVTYPGMNRMDFGYYRNPIKNKVDGSACGVSTYESAVDLIKKADIQGARLDWEYESGERAIHVDNKVLKQDTGL